MSVERRTVATPSSDWPALAARVADHQDREAFTILFGHFAPRLNGYLLKIGCEPALAQEIAQETMTVLWRKAALFDPAKSSLATWLYRIARNRRIDAMRRVRFEPLDPDVSDAISADDAPADALIDGAQREQRVRDSLVVLPVEQLALVKLAFFEGLSHSAIAGQTGLPLGTVKSRLRLAFARLRKALESNGVGGAG